MINKFDMQQDIERVLVSEEDIHARIREVNVGVPGDFSSVKGHGFPFAFVRDAYVARIFCFRQRQKPFPIYR